MQAFRSSEGNGPVTQLAWKVASSAKAEIQARGALLLQCVISSPSHQLKIYRPSGLLTPLLHTGTVSAANAAQAAKNHDVVFCGEDGVFMFGTTLRINRMSSALLGYPSHHFRLSDPFGVLLTLEITCA